MGDADAGPWAGWFGVFPELPGYQRSFLAPVVDPSGHRQTARYDWTGGALKRLEVIMALDPEARPPDGDARPVRVGSYDAWLWAPGGDFGGGRLVLALAAAKSLSLEARDAGPWEGLVELAGHFPLARVAVALDSPPRADPRRDFEAFRALPGGAALAEVDAWVGPADRAAGGDPLELSYEMPDGSRMVLGFAGSRGLVRARHEAEGGAVTDLDLA